MYIENPSVNIIVDSVEKLTLSNRYSVLILLGEKTRIDLTQLVNILNSKNIKFAGGIFPKVINNDNVSTSGAIIKLISDENVSIYFDTTETFNTQFAEFTESTFTTAYVLTSGLSSKSSDHLRTLYTNLGNDVNFLGGGAGRTIENSEGILFCKDGVFSHGTIVTLTKKRTTTGSLHGWSKIFGPFIATKTNQNFIEELNWENAFVVYQRFLKEHLDILIDHENFELNSIHYPFGIYKENKEYIVRDPMKVSREGFLQCVGNIPENSLIDLMSVDKNDLHALPKKIVSQSIDKNSTVNDVLIFDCISRAIHLKDGFYTELINLTEQIKKNQININLEGVLSIGEIYSSGEGYPELLNKSIVLGFSYTE
ncbi:MAG: FIST C-terminal domain-containing protein [Labilibaculum sp.]|nr:FIST C-terminal domain-containing protein [Labilibaculum sp.]MBI9058742.1 FIST C-terminal domain-containing protein [Labilibaculum sp.]